MNQADAASNFVVNYQTSKDSVQLNWESDAAYFQLYNGKDLIWEGSSHEYLVDNLPSKKQQKFFLLALDENKKVIAQTQLKVMTKGDKDKTKGKERKLDGVTIDAIINKDQVIINWDKHSPDEDGIVKLYKNEQYLGEYSVNSYVDNNIEPDKYYTYRVIGETKRSKKEIENAIDELKSKGLAITDDVVKQVFGEHDQAPSHEMYAYIPNSDAMLVIFQHPNKELEYLSPIYPNRSIEFSIYN